jgi:hypothetical protein
LNRALLLPVCFIHIYVNTCLDLAVSQPSIVLFDRSNAYLISDSILSKINLTTFEVKNVTLVFAPIAATLSRDQSGLIVAGNNGTSTLFSFINPSTMNITSNGSYDTRAEEIYDSCVYQGMIYHTSYKKIIKTQPDLTRVGTVITSFAKPTCLGVSSGIVVTGLGTGISLIKYNSDGNLHESYAVDANIDTFGVKYNDFVFYSTPTKILRVDTNSFYVERFDTTNHCGLLQIQGTTLYYTDCVNNAINALNVNTMSLHLSLPLQSATPYCIASDSTYVYVTSGCTVTVLSGDRIVANNTLIRCSVTDCITAGGYLYLNAGYNLNRYAISNTGSISFVDQVNNVAQILTADLSNAVMYVYDQNKMIQALRLPVVTTTSVPTSTPTTISPTGSVTPTPAPSRTNMLPIVLGVVFGVGGPLVLFLIAGSVIAVLLYRRHKRREMHLHMERLLDENPDAFY